MSTVVNGDSKSPNTVLKGTVGHGGSTTSTTIRGNPCVGGQLNSPCTVGNNNGTLPTQGGVGTGPLVTKEVFHPADMGVGVLPLPHVSEGDAKHASVATFATQAEKAQNAIITINTNQASNIASCPSTLAINTMNQIATSQSPQSAISHMPACQIAGTIKGQALHTATTTEENTNYNLFLSSGAPISPIREPLDSTNAKSPTGELPSMAILEIPMPNSDDNLELIINSILSFTNKCLADKLRSEKIIKLLTDNYSEKNLNKAWKFSRSLLEKNDRPKRLNVNYENRSNNKNSNLLASQIIKMVKK